ncbi:VITRN protein, partial [Amia calva]|nr:VITRN protein [Amia calva]
MSLKSPLQITSIPWRNNNISILNKDPPLSEQGETIVGAYLLILGWMSWFGNSIVIFILYKQRACLQPTDYLTFNLAVSDASISVFGYSRGIIEIFNVFRDGGFLITSIWTCQVDGFLTLLFGLASINTLTVISVTRYIKGCHPNRAHCISNHTISVSLILIWVGALFWSSAPLLGWGSYTVGKAKKGVTYPSILEFLPSRSTTVKTEAKKSEQETRSTKISGSSSEKASDQGIHFRREIYGRSCITVNGSRVHSLPCVSLPGSIHPLYASVVAAASSNYKSCKPFSQPNSTSGQPHNAQGKGPTQAFRGTASYASRYAPRSNPGIRRQDPAVTYKRQSGAPANPAVYDVRKVRQAAYMNVWLWLFTIQSCLVCLLKKTVYNRVQHPTAERIQQAVQSNPTFARRDWPHTYQRPDWHSGHRRPTDVSHAVPDSGYTWTEVDSAETPAHNPRPAASEYDRWLLSFGQARKLLHSRQKTKTSSVYSREHAFMYLEPIDAWKPEVNPFDAGFNVREQDPIPRVSEPVSQGDPNCKVDMAFLMDGSWSIGKRRFKIQKEFLAEVSQVLNVGVAGPMMGIIQYGDDPVTEFNLKAFSSSRDLTPAVERIVQKGGQSNVGKALSYINRHFFSDTNGNRGGAPNVAVVLVDGWPTDKVEEAARLARESGINIFFVTIEGPDENEKQSVVEANFVDKAVCRTNGFYSLNVPSWFSLRKSLQPLVKRVCDTDRLVCSKTCLNANDIAFVIDGSSSVGTGNFRTVLQFVANITKEFEISDTDTRVGAVQYTYEQRLEFAFGQYNSKPELLNAIKRINYWSGGTSTGAAITYAAEQLFSKSKPNKRKIMIVITDGRSYDDVRAPALAVHRTGVIAYSIGIAWAAQDELEYIATDPDKEHSFFVDEFDNLYKFVDKIIHNICQEFNSQPRN